MAKDANQFIFRDEYEKWLLDNGVKSTGAYCPQDEYKCNGNDYLFLDIIGRFAKEKECFYVDALFQEWKSFIEKTFKDKERSNHLSYLNKYKIFVENICNGSISLSTSGQNNNDDTVLMSVRESINKSQDGMKSLEMHLGEEDFVKLAIESSYFFSPDLVVKRFEEIKEYICQQKVVDPAFDKEQYKVKFLPARYSSKEDAEDGVHEPVVEEGKVYFKLQNAAQRLCVIYQEGARGKNKECGGNTCGGGNGNARVCQLIKDRTGYDLGATTNKKHFRNFIISHIWGNAIDPRYFTNLWNIAIVPAWANHLLDKDETGTLGSKLKATIQKIITELYDFDNLDWPSIQMTPPSYNNKEVISGRYQINIMEQKSGNAPLGKISKVSIPV